MLAAKLVADLRGGADFVKLVEQYSDDSTSKAKAGDFATIHGSDNIPQEVKSVVMGLKQGDDQRTATATQRDLYLPGGNGIV